MLDNNGAPCSTNNDGEYSQDKCANEVVEKESFQPSLIDLNDWITLVYEQLFLH